MKDKDKTTTLLIRRIPRSLKAQFKAYCAAQEQTIRDNIIDHMAAVTTATNRRQNNAN